MPSTSRPCEPPLPDPLGFFLTWNTYGTWLPGDARGWVKYQHGFQLPDPMLELESAAIMTEDACVLDQTQREVVNATISQHCRIRHWELHAVNCRTNHVHCVISALFDPEEMRAQLKAWCTRKLKSHQADQGIEKVREHWWAERGNCRWLNDAVSLEAAIVYVRDGQDLRWRNEVK